MLGTLLAAWCFGLTGSLTIPVALVSAFPIPTLISGALLARLTLLACSTLFITRALFAAFRVLPFFMRHAFLTRLALTAWLFSETRTTFFALAGTLLRLALISGALLGPRFLRVLEIARFVPAAIVAVRAAVIAGAIATLATAIIVPLGTLALLAFRARPHLGSLGALSVPRPGTFGHLSGRALVALFVARLARHLSGFLSSRPLVAASVSTVIATSVASTIVMTIAPLIAAASFATPLIASSALLRLSLCGRTTTLVFAAIARLGLIALGSRVGGTPFGLALALAVPSVPSASATSTTALPFPLSLGCILGVRSRLGTFVDVIDVDIFLAMEFFEMGEVLFLCFVRVVRSFILGAAALGAFAPAITATSVSTAPVAPVTAATLLARFTLFGASFRSDLSFGERLPSNGRRLGLALTVAPSGPVPLAASLIATLASALVVPAFTLTAFTLATLAASTLFATAFTLATLLTATLAAFAAFAPALSFTTLVTSTLSLAPFLAARFFALMLLAAAFTFMALLATALALTTLAALLTAGLPCLAFGALPVGASAIARAGLRLACCRALGRLDVVIIIDVEIILLVDEILVVLVYVGGVGEVEKGVLRFADVDERRVHPLDHALNLAQINRADMALLIGDFEKKLS